MRRAGHFGAVLLALVLGAAPAFARFGGGGGFGGGAVSTAEAVALAEGEVSMAGVVASAAGSTAKASLAAVVFTALVAAACTDWEVVVSTD